MLGDDDILRILVKKFETDQWVRYEKSSRLVDKRQQNKFTTLRVCIWNSKRVFGRIALIK